jgi:hypothetical protein
MPIFKPARELPRKKHSLLAGILRSNSLRYTALAGLAEFEALPRNHHQSLRYLLNASVKSLRK